LIAEQYTGYRVHGHKNYDSLLRENTADKKDGDLTPFDSLSQRLELQRKAEERMSALIEEEKAMEAAAKERVEDFKNSMNRRYSVAPEDIEESPTDGSDTFSTLPPPLSSPVLTHPFFSRTTGSQSTSKSARYRRIRKNTWLCG